MHVQFLLIGEGSTESALIEHLANLCVAVGATEASGAAPPFERLDRPVGHDLVPRLRAAQVLNPQSNLYFVHRDADAADPEPRYAEIAQALTASAVGVACVAVVPIYETEAWLLADVPAIRRVAGRPNGRTPLELPPLQRIEQTPQPKEVLTAALFAAAQPLSGRRAQRFRSEFAKQRRQLLEELTLDGAHTQLSAWQRLRDDTAAAIDALRMQERAEGERE
jgi:hypothetical protein